MESDHRSESSWKESSPIKYSAIYNDMKYEDKGIIKEIKKEYARQLC
jgi:hypothetical protein